MKRLGPVKVAAACGAILVWAFWPTLSALVLRWSEDARYSHGFLVPAFALFLLWRRRSEIRETTLQSHWAGVALIGIGAGLRLLGAYIYFDWFDGISFLICLAGLALLLGGWAFLRWSLPAIGFLFFMIPLPFRLELALGWRLQQIATVASTYALQTLGFPALGEGNVIVMDEARIGVVEACSGLSMMIMFFALATGVVLVVKRPLIDKLLIVASAVPIALIANIARITVTGVLHETIGHRFARIVYHDLAGWLMIPLALALLGLELAVLSRLWVEVPPVGPTPVGFTRAPGADPGAGALNGKSRGSESKKVVAAVALPSASLAEAPR